jgi:hypothetical protein
MALDSNQVAACDRKCCLIEAQNTDDQGQNFGAPIPSRFYPELARWIDTSLLRQQLGRVEYTHKKVEERNDNG